MYFIRKETVGVEDTAINKGEIFNIKLSEKETFISYEDGTKVKLKGFEKLKNSIEKIKELEKMGFRTLI